MYREILVPLDGSETAESAIPFALSLAERSGGRLHLATVVPSSVGFGSSPAEQALPLGRQEDERARFAGYLERVQARFAQTGTTVPVTTHLLSGNPVRVLHDWILKEGADQVVMTTHGHGPLRRVWLGSVADGLVRRVPCPILLCRPTEGRADFEGRPGFARILLPLDGSDIAEAMVLWVEGLARLHGAAVSLLTVVTPVSTRPSGSASAEAEGVEAEIGMEAARRYLTKVEDRLREDGIRVDSRAVHEASAAAGILAYAGQVGADLIALSTHGRGGVSRMVLGSVADKIIRGAEVPVLVHLDAEDV